ncbi:MULTISPECIES: hypothetical protein [unclassified Moorena]|uniref:hypothetical protein n=1 Tax=unclassified Moorena TaxID=2683338 RepID=UPI0013C09196|nr:MULTISPECIES: hypothetical protein [unclassified Moorena]NEO10572.1 hypothetical protein [Moorena sp. SIO3I8]NEP28411.1 hypothetical protein [Moorena sp. SIO3I6]
MRDATQNHKNAVKKNSRLYNALNTWRRSCQSLGTQSSPNGLYMDGGGLDP